MQDFKITRRGAKAYYLKDMTTGDKIKVDRSMAPEVYVNGEPRFTIGYDGIIHGQRVWDEEAGRWFYPFTDEEETKYVQAIFDTIQKDQEK